MGPGEQSSSLGFSENLKVPKLSEDGSNWVLYKSQVTSAILAKKLRRYLNGTAKEPQPPTAPGVDPDADEKYEDALDAYESHLEKVKLLNNTIVSRIILSCYIISIYIIPLKDGLNNQQTPPFCMLPYK